MFRKLRNVMFYRGAPQILIVLIDPENVVDVELRGQYLLF
jgi:hypothetical protein